MRISPQITIDDNELVFRFVRSSGPGGQNVNKVATAAELSFDVAASPSLSPAVKARLAALAGGKMTRRGVLLIDARRFRSQAMNRNDALERLREMILRAAAPPRARRATRPTAASRARRLDAKHRRSELKRRRQGRLTQD
jgi:ribosome-associated protein